MTRLAKRTFLGRNKTRLELWEEHLKDLDKALKCVEDQCWLEALWKQGSNGMRSGGVGSDATVVGRGLVAFFWVLGIVCVYAKPLRSGMSQGGTGRMRALLLPSGEGADGPQGVESAGAQHPGRMASFSSF